MTNKKVDGKQTPGEPAPSDELYYDPKRAAAQVVNPDLSEATGIGAGGGVEAQKEQVLSAEHFKGSRVRAELDARDDIAFADIDASELRGKAGTDTFGRKIETNELTEARKEAEFARTYEGDPAPDGSDHVVGVDWYNNRTATIDDHLKSPDQLREIQQKRVEQGAAPGSKKDSASKPADKAELEKQSEKGQVKRDTPETKLK